MHLQRRYSITGRTPLEDVEAMRSPKLQALDTSVQTTSCGLCEGGVDAARTSSKRSATQLPSPNTPSSQELPTKIARLGLEHGDMDFDTSEGYLTDPYPDCDWAFPSFDDSSTTPSSTPPSSLSPEPTSLADRKLSESVFDDEDAAHQEPLDLALSPPLFTDFQLPASFVTLPPELRHQIYLHLPDLVLPYPLIYCLSTFAQKKQHPLASVSRLIRSEALAIYYSYNTWIIKLEFKLMYEAFYDWIVQLGEWAGSLRLVTIAVRGSLFKPRTSHSSNININGTLVNGIGPVSAALVEGYSPPDGDASFKIDLSEKYAGGKVELVRNDGRPEAGEEARVYLQKLVGPMWEKRRAGTLNGQDWVFLVDDFVRFTT